MQPNTKKAETPAPRPPAYPVSAESTEEDTSLGAIQIHNSVIAIIARMAAVRVAGVADVVGSLVGDMAGKIGLKPADRGVHVELAEDRLVIGLSLAVEYGAFIPKVAWQVQSEVRQAVEELTGKSVKAVNVTVRALRAAAGQPAVPPMEEEAESEGTPAS
jgi:uncharacterized alkaline shock family protein YloU